MRVMIKKWGNSASVRIPASVMQVAHLSLDEEVEMSVVDGNVMIEPVKLPVYKLSEMLDGMNELNLHSEVDFGDSVGRELL